MSSSEPQTVRPHTTNGETPRCTHKQARQSKASTQALDLREQRPPVCSWERSNGQAALGTATITLTDASASRVARLPFYCQPAAASHKLNNPPAGRVTNSQARRRRGELISRLGSSVIGKRLCNQGSLVSPSMHPQLRA